MHPMATIKKTRHGTPKIHIFIMPGEQHRSLLPPCRPEDPPSQQHWPEPGPNLGAPCCTVAPPPEENWLMD